MLDSLNTKRVLICIFGTANGGKLTADAVVRGQSNSRLGVIRIVNDVRLGQVIHSISHSES